MNKETVIYTDGIIGYTNLKRWVEMETEKTIKQRYYNGRICFQIGKKRIGLNAFKKNCKKVSLKLNQIPF